MKPIFILYALGIILLLLIIAGFVFLPPDDKENLAEALFVSFPAAGGYYFFQRDREPRKRMPSRGMNSSSNRQRIVQRSYQCFSGIK